jgi:hypothetical protein
MCQVNEPDLVAELTQLYLEYEKALRDNDLATLDKLFWDSPEVVRFGATENLYGIQEIRNFRQHRPTQNLAREISQLKVVTFGQDTAAITLEFRRSLNGTPRLGRQSQLWRKFPQGWRIVSAHVSLLESGMGDGEWGNGNRESEIGERCITG